MIDLHMTAELNSGVTYTAGTTIKDGGYIEGVTYLLEKINQFGWNKVTFYIGEESFGLPTSSPLAWLDAAMQEEKVV